MRRIAIGMMIPESLMSGVPNVTGDGSETHFAVAKMTRVRVERDMLVNWTRAVSTLLIDANFGIPKEGVPDVNFKASTTLELEQKANFYRKIAMFQGIGTEDIWWVREDLEIREMGVNGIGEPLVKIQNQPGQGSADGGGGDTTDSTDSPKREGTGAVN